MRKRERRDRRDKDVGARREKEKACKYFWSFGKTCSLNKGKVKDALFLFFNKNNCKLNSHKSFNDLKLYMLNLTFYSPTCIYTFMYKKYVFI